MGVNGPKVNNVMIVKYPRNNTGFAVPHFGLK